MYLIFCILPTILKRMGFFLFQCIGRGCFNNGKVNFKWMSVAGTNGIVCEKIKICPDDGICVKILFEL